MRDLTWLGAASLAVKPFWFAFMTVVCVRVLGDERYGVMMTALSLTAMTFTLTGFGMEKYTMREVAGKADRASLFFTNFIVLRLALIVLASGVTLVVAFSLSYDATLLVTVGAACLYHTAHSITKYSRSYLKAFKQLKYDALSVVVEKVALVGGGSVLLVATGAPHWTLLGLAGGAALTALLTAGGVARWLAPLQPALLDPAFLKRAAYAIIPFGLAGVFGTMLSRVDTVMVQAMLGDASAGQYGLAYRIVEALSLLPFVVAHATAFPRLSARYREGRLAGFRRLVRLTEWGLGSASLLITLAVFFLAAPLIQLIADDPALYPAIPALRVACWMFLFTCLRKGLDVALLAMGQQRFVAWTMGGTLVFNVGLNALLIPTVGISGAALATVLSEAAVLAVYVVRYRRAVRP